MTKKFISWNVNGVRAVTKKGFVDFVSTEQPDILCLQEIKAFEEQIPEESRFDGKYNLYVNSAQRPGYSGTAVYSKEKPIMTIKGLDDFIEDIEGRVLTLEFDKYFLVTVYTPNSKRGLERLDYRQGWDKAFLAYVKYLEKSKPVIFCGDLNVAHKEIDLARPKNNHKSAGFTDEERAGFDNFVDAGFVDTFRQFDDCGENYTWWSYMRGARARNVGWRIDYFCTSDSVKTNVKDAFILPDVLGSDHCPVGINFNI